jgi:DHA1 family tetracycline resistance protein-like MFS transporter
MAVLFLVVFVDLVGFGLLIPLLPFYVQRTGTGPEIITIVLGLYSLAQVIAAPVWGRLSDRYGRKPILAVTCVGLGLSYVLLAIADSLALVVASRIVGGLAAGNIAAAQAYVADVTGPETRAKGMGVLGAAFGLGFIIGPTIGGLFAGGSVENADYRSPALAAMALSFAAAIGVAIFLKESLPKVARSTVERRATWREKLEAAVQRRALLMLVVTGFLVITAFAQFETTFALSVNAVYAYGPREIGFIFGFMGAVSVLVQGLFMGALTKRFGERRLAIIAVALFIAGYVAIAASANFFSLLAACAALALASALFNPSVTSLVSQEAARGERGAVMGAYQSATALGRVAGPAFSGALFAAGMALPYLVAAALAALALALVVLAHRSAK